jgi:hypothetical protein
MKKIDAIEEAVRAVHTPGEVPEPPVEAKEDTRYVTLKKPITVGNRVIDKLFCDVSEMSGEQYFRLVHRFRDENHYVFSTSLNKLGEDIFQGMVVAELNSITFEDLRKLSFKDVHKVFQRVQNFLYSAG